ncbi:MAG: amidohydrolase [Paraprevotella sp.]|nr:amidohydrolase [Paraprevotella sp.]MBR0361176.1 amidohydrolase [Paraprevotella sp.]
MKITLLQRDIEWGNPPLNILRADVAIDCHPGSDLYVLPEMFSTGFCTHPEGMAESTNSDTLKWMKQKAADTNAAIAGSVAVTEDGKYFNRFYFVKPDGEVTYYDKKHLFTYGGEHHRFTAGDRRVIVEFRGVRILLEICYDLRFPVWARNHKDYDMILYVASWPTPRVEAWSALLVARAIENQCYVAGVNRVGNDPSCEYCGASVVIDPYGKTIASCILNEESEATADIDMDMLATFRKKFPVLDDADELAKIEQL